MTNSTSSISRSSLLVVIATLVLWVGSASADRRRVVVLEFEGPKAEKFHDDVVKLLKKSHTVISVDKWNGAAEDLDAGKVTAKNVKKVAKKLKVDGIVTGIVDKRRDEYIIRLKLRAGTTGELTGTSVQTKAEGPRLDGQAQRDIKDELIGAIDELDSNRGGDEEEEEEDTPKKKKKGDEEEEEEDTPKKSGFSRKKAAEEEEKAAKKAAEEEEKAAKKAKEEEEKAKKKKKADDAEKAALSTKKGDEEEEEEEEETPKSKKRAKSSDDEEEDGGRKKKKKASADDEEEGIEEEAEEEQDPAEAALNLTPGNRAVDAVVGLSFTARKLNFTYAADLGKAPPGYKQTIPVAGALLDVTAYPMAFNHKNKSITKGIGITVLYDQVLKINSQKRYADGAGMQQIADLKTSESRWAVGGVFRYPLGPGAKAIVVGGSLTYGRQKFTVEQVLPNNEPTDIPNVHYTMITPAAFVAFPVMPKITFNLEGAFHAIMDTGAIQQPTQYGASTVTGFELNTGIDYMLLKNVFVRGAFRYETIGFKFKGDPTSQTHTRDTDADQDVTGARDSYVGGTATIGYLY
jgi:hypothetical protein